MPIPVACKCGQKFAVKDELAGKVMKCPKCGGSLQIPASPQKPAAVKPKPAAPQSRGTATAQPAQAVPRGSSLADLFDEAGVKAEVQDNRPRCPHCKEPMAPDAILCVNCGFNVETGKRIHGLASAQGAEKDLYGLADEGGGHGSAAKSVLRKAERTIQDDKVEEYKIRTQGMPIWALAILFGCLVTFGACMSMLPAAEALKYTGIMLAVLPGVVAFICLIMIRVVAFSESLKEGVCVLLIPFYDIYYSWTHWNKCGRLFIIALLCSVLSGLGGGLVAVSPMFKVEEQPTRPK